MSAHISSNKTIIDLNKMVHIALQSPKIGIVNFTILKTFLLELLKALNLQNYEPKFEDNSVRFMYQIIQKINEESEPISADDLFTSKNDVHNELSGNISELVDAEVDTSIAFGRVGVASSKGYLSLEQKPLTERLHSLEDKLGRLEQQINAFNALPPNNAVLDKAKKSAGSSHSASGNANGSMQNSGPIIEIWQYTQLSKRLESNEDGISKLSSLMQDLIADLNGVKDLQNMLSDDNTRLNDNYKNLMEKMKNLEEIQNNYATKDEVSTLSRDIENLNDKMKNLSDLVSQLQTLLNGLSETSKQNLPTQAFSNQVLNSDSDKLDIDGLLNKLKELENKINSAATLDDIAEFVSWPSFENNLKGIKDSLESMTENMSKAIGEQAYKLESITENNANSIARTSPRDQSVLKPGVSDSQPAKTLTPNSMELSFGSFVDSGPEVAQASQVQATRPGSSHPIRTTSAQQRPSSAAHPPVQQRPSSAHPSGKNSRVQSAHPSEQLKDVLYKLGTLNDRHERLKSIVEELQREMSDKLKNVSHYGDDYTQSQLASGWTTLPPIVDAPAQDKQKTERPKSGGSMVSVESHQIKPSNYENTAKLNRKQSESPDREYKLPDDFTTKVEEIAKLKAELDALRGSLHKESHKRQHVEQLTLNLDSEIEKLKKSIQNSLDHNKMNKEDIAALREAIVMLEEKKTDKDWIRYELDKKADKRDLDNKVYRKTFEDACNEISNNINNLGQKSINFENEMRKGTSAIMRDMESKVDRYELDPLKEYIEKQLKKIKKLQKDAQGTNIGPEEDAAGLRKQLLRFHCLSCDRPIVAVPQQPFPSLPNEKGMRPIQSPRPFTTYELEQIRQFQRSNTMFDSNSYDLFGNVRQCGGSHTLTLPHKKVVKVPQQIVEEVVNLPVAAPTTKSEVQIQGQDGHIYKGRIDSKLVVEMKKPLKSANQNNQSNKERPVSAATKDGRPQSPNNADVIQAGAN